MYGPHQGEVLVGLVKIVATTTPPLTARVLNLRFNAGTKFPYHFGPELLGEVPTALGYSSWMSTTGVACAFTESTVMPLGAALAVPV